MGTAGVLAGGADFDAGEATGVFCGDAVVGPFLGGDAEAGGAFFAAAAVDGATGTISSSGSGSLQYFETRF